MQSTSLNEDEIHQTIHKLKSRIDSRFPKSGLGKVCQDLVIISSNTKERLAFVQRPQYLLRGLIALVIVLIVALFAAVIGVFVWYLVAFSSNPFDLGNFVQSFEAEISIFVFLGAALYFLVKLENARKRRKVLRQLHELRSLAHLIDLHQLRKDPEYLFKQGKPTKESPRRDLSAFELSRYLDYCTEMLSLIGKLAVIYGKDFDDDVVLDAVNDVEGLTSDLSRKIWQKIMIIHLSTRQEHARNL